MSDSDPREYYAGRSRRERELADQASDPVVAGIHSEMADRYAEMATSDGAIIVNFAPRVPSTPEWETAQEA